MNQQAFETARTAYQHGDWAAAASTLAACKVPGEAAGAADHLLGNALMKLGRYGEAADAYASALADAGYGHAGALSCNRGRALVAAGRADEAVACFQAALADASYAAPYKANLALGNLYASQGNATEAGVAYRNAAIDESNPDPAGALSKLGDCFMTLGRPVDAVEAYRTALDFTADGVPTGCVYAQLGGAYVASNRMPEAVDAFTQAVSDATYHLTAQQQASFSAAQKALAAINGQGPSATDQMLAAAGYGEAPAPDSTGSYDPLDPLGKSGEFIPSPEDTGFFSVTEEDLMQADKRGRKVKRKHTHTGLRVLVTLLVLLVIAAAAGGLAYWRGYGWPTQEAVVTDLFATGGAGDIGAWLSGGVSAETRSAIEDVMPQSSSTVSVNGVDRSMTSSTVLLTAQLAEGGEQAYQVSLVRDGLSWKVTNVELSFSSQVASGSQATK